MRSRLPLSLRQLGSPPQSRSFSCDSRIQEFDVLLLRQKGEKYSKWHLTAPLRHGARIKLAYGASVPASELIGRRALDRVRDTNGRDVVLHEPTLGGYIIQSARLATPIYPHDANTIVALMDLNPSRPGEEGEEEDGERGSNEPFEVFEAGTGMGSLTLHIARALHAANPPVPPSLRRALVASSLKSFTQDTTTTPDTTKENSEDAKASSSLAPEDQAALDSYRASRRAILHTLDRNLRHATGAFKLIRNFRRAQYLPTIDFHAGGSIASVLEARLAQTRGAPFLSAAVLDLPEAPLHAGPVVRALRRGALFLVFNPSLSQIAEVDEWARATGQPLRLEKVLELPVTTRAEGGGSVHAAAGGREWDLRKVVPRADEGGDGKLVQVMRPKVGDRVGGGGFLGVWRRWPEAEEAEEDTRAEEEEEAAEETENAVEEKQDAAEEKEAPLKEEAAPAEKEDEQAAPVNSPPPR